MGRVGRVTVVTIPYVPRPQQRALHEGLERKRFGVAVCHRRMGKTVAAVNHLIRAALTCTKPRPRFAYIAPTYRQGKSIAWDYLRHFSAPIPGAEVNHSELRIDYPNGGQVRIYGADNPDSLRGIYLDGAVLDEFGLMDRETFTEAIRPTLSDREGWALFLGTPNGRNQFYEVVQQGKTDPEWFYAEFRASETGVLPEEELVSARKSMTEDEYAQEYECSFEASVKGAVYAKEIQAAREQGRIARVPYLPEYRVDTDWDLGFGDATAIWFSQTRPTGEVRLIDYYEAKGEALPHYVNVLDRKGYVYGSHWAPHDIQQSLPLNPKDGRPITHSRWATATSLGIYFQIVPRANRIEDGIHAAKLLFPRCWFDAANCQRGLDALQAYHWKPNTSKDPTGKPLPVHDWASHGADAFRGLAERWYQTKAHPERDAQKAVREAQVDREDKWKWQQQRSAGRGGY